MRTESVHVLNKSIPPVINVFKDNILKIGITVEQSFLFILKYFSKINVQTNNSKGNKKYQQFSLNIINRVLKNRGKDSLIRTEFVPILHKSIPPIINVFKDKILKKVKQLNNLFCLSLVELRKSQHLYLQYPNHFTHTSE